MSLDGTDTTSLPLVGKEPGCTTCKRGCAKELVTCACCGLPQTYETIEFDAEGVCNICRQQEFKTEAGKTYALDGRLTRPK